MESCTCRRGGPPTWLGGVSCGGGLWPGITLSRDGR